MSLLTARDFITKAYKKIGVGAEGEPLTAEQMNDGLDEINLLINSLSGRGLLTTAQIGESFPLIALQAAYTIGIGANFNTSTPFTIISAFVRDGSGYDYPVDIFSREEYNAFPVKTDTGLPRKMFFDPGPTQQAVQAGTISFYPTPDASTPYTLFIYSEKPLTPFSSLDNSVPFPPIYHRMLIYNTALALAPDYARKPMPEVEHIADESMRIIESINSNNKRTVSVLDIPGSPSRPNILTGE
jgi:hypothetical protein